MPNFQGQIINSLIADQKEEFQKLLRLAAFIIKGPFKWSRRPRMSFIFVSLGTMLFGSVQSVCVEIVQRRITVDVRTAPHLVALSHHYRACRAYLKPFLSRFLSCGSHQVMFESLIKQDIAFFDGTMTGQLTSRMTNDVAAVVQPVRQMMWRTQGHVGLTK